MPKQEGGRRTGGGNPKHEGPLSQLHPALVVPQRVWEGQVASCERPLEDMVSLGTVAFSENKGRQWGPGVCCPCTNVAVPPHHPPLSIHYLALCSSESCHHLLKWVSLLIHLSHLTRKMASWGQGRRAVYCFILVSWTPPAARPVVLQLFTLRTLLHSWKWVTFVNIYHIEN